MISPVIWIIFPVVVGLLGVILRYQLRWVDIWISVITAGLGGLALFLPIGRAVDIGPFVLLIDPNLLFSGRQFLIENADRYFLFIIFIPAAVWFSSGLLLEKPNIFAPLGIMVVALWVASLAVEPFLFAAVLIVLATILSLPILVSSAEVISPGILRLLIFHVLGMPFILITGWMLSGIESLPAELDLAVKAAILMGFGFSLWLAVFPFHSWIPMLTQDIEPLVSGFYLYFLPGIIAIFGVSFLDRYSWLRDSTAVLGMIRAVGLLMVLTGGFWAVFQRNLGRIMGFAAIVENGFSLLAIGLGTSIGFELFLNSFIPRAFGFIVFSLALSELKRLSKGLDFRDIRGNGRMYPIVAAGVLFGLFSVAGFPLLAGLPLKIVLFTQLSREYLIFAYGALWGCMGLLFSGLRTMGVLFYKPNNEFVSMKSSIMIQICLGLGVLFLVFLGFFPQVMLNTVKIFPPAFQNLLN